MRVNVFEPFLLLLLSLYLRLSHRWVLQRQTSWLGRCPRPPALSPFHSLVQSFTESGSRDVNTLPVATHTTHVRTSTHIVATRPHVKPNAFARTVSPCSDCSNQCESECQSQKMIDWRWRECSHPSTVSINPGDAQQSSRSSRVTAHQLHLMSSISESVRTIQTTKYRDCLPHTHMILRSSMSILFLCVCLPQELGYLWLPGSRGGWKHWGNLYGQRWLLTGWLTEWLCWQMHDSDSADVVTERIQKSTILCHVLWCWANLEPEPVEFE